MGSTDTDIVVVGSADTDIVVDMALVVAGGLYDQWKKLEKLNIECEIPPPSRLPRWGICGNSDICLSKITAGSA